MKRFFYLFTKKSVLPFYAALAAISLITTSCAMSFEKEENQSHCEKAKITVDLSFGAMRQAIPSNLSALKDYFWTVTAEQKNQSGAVVETVDFKIDNTSSRLLFSGSVSANKTWEFKATAKASPSSTSTILESNVLKIVPSTKTQSITLFVHSSDPAATGSYNLSIAFAKLPPNCRTIIYGIDSSVPQSENSSADITTEKINLGQSDVPCGTHNFYVSLMDTSFKLICQYFTQITILPGLETNKWVTGSSNGSAISQQSLDCITLTPETEFYVAGTGPSYLTQNEPDDSHAGSIAFPFKTLEHALNYCTQPQINYTIYVDGKLSESLPEEFSACNITIKGLSDNALISAESEITTKLSDKATIQFSNIKLKNHTLKLNSQSANLCISEKVYIQNIDAEVAPFTISGNIEKIEGAYCAKILNKSGKVLKIADSVTQSASDIANLFQLDEGYSLSIKNKEGSITSNNVSVYYHDYYQSNLFSGNGTDSSGTALPKIYAKNKGLVTLPTPENDDSVEFLGWYASNTSDDPLTQITVGTSDIHLYAKWKFKKFYLDPIDGSDEYYGYNSLYPVKTIERAADVIQKINPDTDPSNIRSISVESTVYITESKEIDLFGAELSASGDFPAIWISYNNPSTVNVTIKNTTLYASSSINYPSIICDNQNLILDEGFYSSTYYLGISTSMIKVNNGSLKIQNSGGNNLKKPSFSIATTSSNEGLITLNNSDLYITAASLYSCKASESSPVFIKADDDKTHSVEISNLYATSNSGKNGGAIYIEGTESYPVNVTINGNQSDTTIGFSNNTASVSGGAIYAKNAKINLNKYAKFSGNTSDGTGTNNGGGAIYLNNCKLGSTDEPSTSTVSSYFSQNKAKKNGGAIFYINGHDPDSTLLNAKFEENQAQYDRDITTSPYYSGGAVFITYEDSNSSQNLKIQTCKFHKNKATNGGAVAIDANSTVLILSTTFGNYDNSSYINTATNGWDIFLNETPSGYNNSKVTLQSTKLYDMYSLVDFTTIKQAVCKTQCYLGTSKKIIVTNPTSTLQPSFVLKIPENYPTGTAIVSFANSSLRELCQDNFSFVDSSGFVLKASDKDLLVDTDIITAIESLSDGDIPASGSTYSVSSKDSLDKLKTLSESTSFDGVTFVLSDDIVLDAGDPINPIGTEDHPFMGTFDGQGHTINVTIPNSSYSACALFAYAKDAIIKNVTIKGSIGSDGCAGSLIGTGSGNITIDNCISYADVNANSGNYAGGIIGKYAPKADNACCYIKNCINLGSVKGSSYIGGILGGTDNPQNNTMIIYNCANYGQVNTNGASGYVGGITAGSNDDNIAIYLNNCFNDAVLVTSTSTYVAALIPLTTNNCFIDYCYYNNDNIQAALGSCDTNNVVSYTKNSNSTPYTATEDVTITILGNPITDTNILTLLNSYIAGNADYKKWEERDGQLLFQ